MELVKRLGTGFLLAFASCTAIATPINPYSLAEGTPGFGQLEPFDSETGQSLPDWWLFSATAGDTISLYVDRLEPGLDPYLSLYSYVTDTDLLSVNPLAFDDDGQGLYDNNMPGSPYGDPIIDYTITTTGYYLAQVTATQFSTNSIDGLFDYQITFDITSATTPPGTGPAPIPEPGIMGIFGLGLLGLGYSRLFRKRRV